MTYIGYYILINHRRFSSTSPDRFRSPRHGHDDPILPDRRLHRPLAPWQGSWEVAHAMHQRDIELVAGSAEMLPVHQRGACEEVLQGDFGNDPVRAAE